MFFAKDVHCRLMMGNPAFVARCGYDREEEIVGLTDDVIFPPRMADRYRRDDLRVLRTGKPLLGRVELFPDNKGRPVWFVTDKLPLFAKSGRVVGLCGTVRSRELQRAALQPYIDLAPAADYLRANIRQPLDVAALAAMVGLSVRQFGRKFLATFDLTPRAYLMQMRVMHACELLTQTRSPVTQVALESGFYDHSDFARHFRKHMGQTATAYRRQLRGS